MNPSHALLLASTFVSLYVLGQIWFAQVVVYPLFGKVGANEYIAYHRFYSQRIPAVVIVPGFASFVLPQLLVFALPAGVPMWMAIANAACGVIGLLVTVCLEIPRHARLEREGRQEAVIRQLIDFNWPRTLSVSGCAVLSVLMLLSAWPAS
jgi:hypothetical protein